MITYEEMMELYEKDVKKLLVELEKMGSEVKKETASEAMKNIELLFHDIYPEEVIEEKIKESGGKLTKDLIHKRFIVRNLILYVDDNFFQFFDYDSYELLDLKIEVMTALIDGKTPAEILGYDDIFEKMPPEGCHWY